MSVVDFCHVLEQLQQCVQCIHCQLLSQHLAAAYRRVLCNTHTQNGTGSSMLWYSDPSAALQLKLPVSSPALSCKPEHHCCCSNSFSITEHQAVLQQIDLVHADCNKRYISVMFTPLSLRVPLILIALLFYLCGKLMSFSVPP